jgi:hypothetical protein
MLFRSIYASVSDKNIFNGKRCIFSNHIVVIDIWIARVELWRPIQSRTLSYNLSAVDLMVNSLQLEHA